MDPLNHKKTNIIYFLIFFSSIPLFSDSRGKNRDVSPENKKMHLAVMDFEAKDISANESVKITELIRNDIVNTGKFVVLERAQMGQILKEQGFQQTGCTDVSCAVELGKALSANKILVGTVMKLGDQIIITGRIVDVEKGVVEFSDKAVAQSQKDIINSVSTFVERLSGRIGKKDNEGAQISNYDKLKNKYLEMNCPRQSKEQREMIIASFNAYPEDKREFYLMSMINSCADDSEQAKKNESFIAKKKKLNLENKSIDELEKIFIEKESVQYQSKATRRMIIDQYRKAYLADMPKQNPQMEKYYRELYAEMLMKLIIE